MPTGYRAAAGRRIWIDTRRVFELVRPLMGDADDQVQKALSWALPGVEPPASVAREFLRPEAIARQGQTTATEHG